MSTRVWLGRSLFQFFKSDLVVNHIHRVLHKFNWLFLLGFSFLYWRISILFWLLWSEHFRQLQYRSHYVRGRRFKRLDFRRCHNLHHFRWFKFSLFLYFLFLVNCNSHLFIFPLFVNLRSWCLLALRRVLGLYRWVLIFPHPFDHRLSFRRGHLSHFKYLSHNSSFQSYTTLRLRFLYLFGRRGYLLDNILSLSATLSPFH